MEDGAQARAVADGSLAAVANSLRARGEVEKIGDNDQLKLLQHALAALCCACGACYVSARNTSLILLIVPRTGMSSMRPPSIVKSTEGSMVITSLTIFPALKY